MQRHFSNRGEALAEVAAGKMMAHRMPKGKSVFPGQRGRGVTTGSWKAQAPEAIPRKSPAKKQEPSGTPSITLPEV